MSKAIQKIGDWEKVGKLLDRIADRFTDNMKKAVLLSGELVDATVTNHLDSQYDLEWKDLSEDYLRWKINQAYSTQTYTMTGTYRQNIAIKISDDGFSGYVGVSRETESGVELAYVHEYGSEKMKIPERPLWRPTFQEVEPKIIKIFKNAMQKTLQISGA